MSTPASSDSADPSAPERECLNCGARLAGPYCSACGQHAIDYHRSFHHLLHAFLENVFHFEGKFFSTVASLLAKPGQLTRDFVAGRRQSQLNPLRFYIFVSVLFFVGVSVLNHGHLFDVDRTAADEMQQTLTTRLKEAEAHSVQFTPEEQEEFSRQLARATATGQLDEAALDRAIQVAKDAAAERARESTAPEGPTRPVAPLRHQWDFLAEHLGHLSASEILNAIEQRVPTLLFLGVPLFALLLKLFYRRSGRFYIEHLIFSLHLHTWAFLVVMVSSGYVKLAAFGPAWLPTTIALAIEGWAIWYLLSSFRVVYPQSWRKAALKLVLLGLLHGFLLLCMGLLLIGGTILWLAAG